MLSTNTRRLFPVLIAVILIVLPLSGCIGGPGDGRDEHIVWRGGYEVGDFIEYYYSTTFQSGTQSDTTDGISRVIVMDVTETNFT
jgi:hypothetical protein